VKKFPGKAKCGAVNQLGGGGVDPLLNGVAKCQQYYRQAFRPTR